MINLQNLSPEQVEVVENLRTLDFSDEDIIKSLGLNQDDSIEKSIEDQLTEKDQEINELKSKIEKSEAENSFEEIQKSFSDLFDQKVGTTNELIKSLTGTIVALKEDNEELKKGNEKLAVEYSELKKSIEANNRMLDKIAEMSPGLRSIRSGAEFTQRFEKSVTNDGKEILSKSQNKGEISSKLNLKMNDLEFVKSHGQDVSNYEISGRMSEKLEKAIKDEFKIEFVD